MKHAILGTGSVGRALAAKLLELGHEVAIGTRDVARTLAAGTPEKPGFPGWHREHPRARLLPIAEAAGWGETVWNATKGEASLSVFGGIDARHLAGKILVDVANPLDFSKGMPPSLFVVNTDSLGEQIQRALPETKVVKVFNTLNGALMVDPKGLSNGDHTLFLCGNDGGARGAMKELLATFGWKDVLDLGDLTAARGMEMLLPLWIRIYGQFKTPRFQFKVVRD